MWANDYKEVLRLFKAGQLEQAQTLALTYLTNHPRDPQMRFIHSSIQTELGQPEQAITNLLSLTQDYPELAEPYNNLAVLYAAQKQYEQAKNALEIAIRNRPDYATAFENLGDVYAQLASQAYAQAQHHGANLQLQNKQTKLAQVLSTTQKKAPAPQSNAQIKATTAPEDQKR